MIADMISNKTFEPIGTEFLIWGRKLNPYFVFVTKLYFAVPRNVRLNSALYLYEEFKQRRTSANCF